MGLFSANEIVADGKRGVQLEYRLNKFDYRARTIVLRVIRPLEGSGNTPFAYQYDEESDDRAYPVIRIVAGPGVSVLALNFPSAYAPSAENPEIEVVRVQDPEQVPPLATDLFSFVGSDEEEINSPDGPWSAFRPHAENYLRITRFGNRTIFHHPATGSALTVKVPVMSFDPNSSPDADERFQYRVDPDAMLGERANTKQLPPSQRVVVFRTTAETICGHYSAKPSVASVATTF